MIAVSSSGQAPDRMCMQPSSIIIRASRVVSSPGQAPDCMWSLFLPPFSRQCKHYLAIVSLPTPHVIWQPLQTRRRVATSLLEMEAESGTMYMFTKEMPQVGCCLWVCFVILIACFLRIWSFEVILCPCLRCASPLLHTLSSLHFPSFSPFF